MKLTERAVLTKLHLSIWSGMLVDRKVTQEVNETYNADKEAGRYNKRLVASRFLKGVSSAANRMRGTHRTLTLPWEDDGTRILSTMGWANYNMQMRTARILFERAVKEFIACVPDAVEEAKPRLGQMFNEDDYLEPEKLKLKFGVDVEIKQIPDAKDFRAKLGDASVKAVVKDIEERTNAKVQAAMNNVFERVADSVGKLLDKLRIYQPGDDEHYGAGGQFRDSLVYNIKELAELLPSLNITGDKRLKELEGELLNKLVKWGPDHMRTDEKIRNDTADEAERILKKVKEFMG